MTAFQAGRFSDGGVPILVGPLPQMEEIPGEWLLTWNANLSVAHIHELATFWPVMPLMCHMDNIFPSAESPEVEKIWQALP